MFVSWCIFAFCSGCLLLPSPHTHTHLFHYVWRGVARIACSTTQIERKPKTHKQQSILYCVYLLIFFFIILQTLTQSECHQYKELLNTSI